MQIRTETRVGIFILVALGIFFYMTMKLNVFRLDRAQYKSQVVYFDDVSGLEKKADVKIAGVKVGWVEKVELVPDHAYKAKAYVMIMKKYLLYRDAYAVVRQEGLLGTKYLEIIPGDPLLPTLGSEETIGVSGRPSASVDEILHKVDQIASNVQDVTYSLKTVFGGPEGTSGLQSTIDNFKRAAEKIADFSAVLDRTLSHNEDNINGLIGDLRVFAEQMKENLPNIGQDIHRLSEQLSVDFLPSFRTSVERMSAVFDTDIARVANKLEATTVALEEAALQARDGFRNINSVAEKIDEGKGLIGKLINEDEAYQDLRLAVGGLKNYFAKVDNLSIIVDGHGEYMYRPAEHVTFEDAKGYFDIRIHPNDDLFYVLQIVGSQKGNIRRRILYKDWFVADNQQVIPTEVSIREIQFPELVGKIVTTQRTLDTFKYGLQVGKIFKDLAFRFGLFENTVGMGVDFDIPFGTDKFRWVTTFEAFDFRGRDRIDDNRPHLKWLNRIFLLRNIYMDFGADDFISRHNANGFFGAGVRFSDDDIKYIAAKIGFAGFTGIGD